MIGSHTMNIHSHHSIYIYFWACASPHFKTNILHCFILPLTQGTISVYMNSVSNQYINSHYRKDGLTNALSLWWQSTFLERPHLYWNRPWCTLTPDITHIDGPHVGPINIAIRDVPVWSLLWTPPFSLIVFICHAEHGNHNRNRCMKWLYMYIGRNIKPVKLDLYGNTTFMIVSIRSRTESELRVILP